MQLNQLDQRNIIINYSCLSKFILLTYRSSSATKSETTPLHVPEISTLILLINLSYQNLRSFFVV